LCTRWSSYATKQKTQCNRKKIHTFG
jgi:hypothetical protein